MCYTVRINCLASRGKKGSESMNIRSFWSKGIALCLGAVFAGLVLFFTAAPVAAADGESYGGRVTTSSTALNVRSTPSATSAKLTTLPKGSYVTVVGVEKGWYKIEFGKGIYGYCSPDYLTPVSGSYPAYVSAGGGNLNVRSGPSTAYDIENILPHGRCLVVIGQSDGWYRVIYNGDEVGYVSKKYISVSKPADIKEEYGAVYLSVPSYKQKDSRWSGVKLGSSGKTIGQIGCTTTALAMTESYRLGYTVYPNQMASRLSYTSGGALYWPSNYSQYYGSDYLKKAYSLLKEGKPVIIGAKTSSGKTHWVVITGFKGNALTASNFIINDPGSTDTVDLATYMGKYPIFMKLTYYK